MRRVPGVEKKMKNALISACLLGVNCKYSGGNNKLPPEKLEKLQEKYHLIPVCPEAYGGLETPRAPSEINGGRVLSKDGKDVTGQFKRGAEAALSLAQLFEADIAILKENSPSCGSGAIYDGTFSGKLVPGDGMTAQLLKKYGIKVIGESKI